MSPCTALAAACLALVEAPDFSDDWRAPTELDLARAATLSGNWSGKDDHDILAISGLDGGDTLLFTFRPPADEVGYSFSAGGALLFRPTPFRHSAWEGRGFGRPALDHGDPAPQTFALTLPQGFNRSGGEQAYIGLYGTHGALDYTISVLGP